MPPESARPHDTGGCVCACRANAPVRVAPASLDSVHVRRLPLPWQPLSRGELRPPTRASAGAGRQGGYAGGLLAGLCGAVPGLRVPRCGAVAGRPKCGPTRRCWARSEP